MKFSTFRHAKLLVAASVVAITSGCASHAKIDKFALETINSPAYHGKSINHEVLYSQIEPGFLNSAHQQELTPLKDATLSMAASNVMDNFESKLAKGKPLNTTIVTKGGDLLLRTTVIANDKKGPAFGEHQLAESLAKNVLTFGLAGSDYDVVADFSIRYELYFDNALVHDKRFVINERVDHTSGNFEFNRYSNLNDAAAALMDKHVSMTLNTFYKEAAEKLPTTLALN
ncbi:MAG: hypothetical protein GJ680_18095 [Alteromonadaceae bacterium]|nr:hypothetical protein [Alteromonadaceae bacterium]